MATLFGTDPEFFVCEVRDGKEYAIPVPHFIRELGVNEIGHDPKQKHPRIIAGDDFNVIMDGVAFEMNCTPSKTAAEMYGKIQRSLSAIGELADKHGYIVSTKPSVYYDFWRWYVKDDALLEQCGIFGCDPDEDAILLDYNSPEVDVTSHPFRYGGGHFHMSDDNMLLQKHPIPMIKNMAITTGLFSIASSPYPELEKQRMFKYGQPGRFRVQHYKGGVDGIEYRSPSNSWTSSLEGVEGMFEWANKAYEFLKDPKRTVALWEEYLNPTVDAIRNVDQTLARSILSAIA